MTRILKLIFTQKYCKIVVLTAVNLEKLTNWAVDFSFPIAMDSFSLLEIILSGLEHHLELFWSLEVLKPAIICSGHLMNCRIKIIVKTYSTQNKTASQFQGELDMDTGLTVDCFQSSTLETASPSGLLESELQP